MTDTQRKKLSDIISLNHDIVQKRNELIQMEAMKEALDSELMEDMGEDSYNETMNGFKRLFAPKS